MTNEIKKNIEVENYKLPKWILADYGIVNEVKDGIVVVKVGLNTVGMSEMVIFEKTGIKGIVNFLGKEKSITVLGSIRNIKVGDMVKRLKTLPFLPVTQDLLGQRLNLKKKKFFNCNQKRYMFTKVYKFNNNTSIKNSFRNFNKKGGEDPHRNINKELIKGHYLDKTDNLTKVEVDKVLFVSKIRGSYKNINTEVLGSEFKNQDIVRKTTAHPSAILLEKSQIICIFTGNTTGKIISTVDNEGNIIGTPVYTLGNYLNGLGILNLDSLKTIFNIHSFLASYTRRMLAVQTEYNEIVRTLSQLNTEEVAVEDIDYIRSSLNFYRSNNNSIYNYFNNIIINELSTQLNLEEYRLQLGLTDVSDADIINMILWALTSRFTVRYNLNNDDIYLRIITASENSNIFKERKSMSFRESNIVPYFEGGTTEITTDLFNFLFLDNILTRDITPNYSVNFVIGLYNNIDFFEEYINNNNGETFLEYINTYYFNSCII